MARVLEFNQGHSSLNNSHTLPCVASSNQTRHRLDRGPYRPCFEDYQLLTADLQAPGAVTDLPRGAAEQKMAALAANFCLTLVTLDFSSCTIAALFRPCRIWWPATYRRSPL